jgi:hypothetical protein
MSENWWRSRRERGRGKTMPEINDKCGVCGFTRGLHRAIGGFCPENDTSVGLYRDTIFIPILPSVSPPSTVTVLKIVKAYLEANGYDGLYYIEDECGCYKDDLAPCAGMNCFNGCRPGVAITIDGEPGIGPKEDKP